MRRASSRARRTFGWIISALILSIYFSPHAQYLRALPGTLSVARGQDAVLEAPFPLTTTIQTAPADASIAQSLSSVDTQAQTSRATISLFGLLPLREVDIQISDDLRLYPGGQAVGVALHTKGVLVVGTSDLTGANSPARMAGIKPGDVIMAADGRSIQSTDELTAIVSAYGATPLPLTIQRGESTLSLTLHAKRDGQSGEYRIGAWVRDSTAGVGTMSFYGALDENHEMRYGALGHAITDADTQQILTVGVGEIMLADVVDVRKGQAGHPGELKGSFLREKRILGSISRNNAYGIYGSLTDVPVHPLYPDGLPIGRRDAVHTGPATILCTVDAEGMKEYEVQITQVTRQSSPAQRSMVLKVTDERLLAKTAGIVQGMSGSPIIQDGRLIGAVTHVFVNDPARGYGLYIEQMLEAAR